MLILGNDQYDFTVDDDFSHTPGSADNARSYDIEYPLDNSPFHPSSQHSVTVRDGDRVVRSCILVAGGGATGIHEHSALLLGDSCVVAVGPFMTSLRIPSLELEWKAEVDAATCFGVYYSAAHDCLISHGELEIARVERGGKILWRVSGADIFTNGFELRENYVQAVDYCGRQYRIDMTSGKI